MEIRYMGSHKPVIFVFALVILSLITYGSAYGYLMSQPDIDYSTGTVEIFQDTIIKAYDKPTFSETVTVVVTG